MQTFLNEYRVDMLIETARFWTNYGFCGEQEGKPLSVRASL